MYLSHSSQQGMSLVTVMLLSSLAGILVLGSLRDNIIQERLSGNFQKKMNAQLVAERGIFETHAALLALLQDNPDATLEELMAAVGGEDLAKFGNGGLSDMRYSVDLSKDSSGQLLLASRGKRFEGSSALKARFELTSGGGSSPFANAIVGCEGVDLSGSGKIDSFNSNNGGSYDPNAPGQNANVTTIEPDSDITLGGHSPIYGDVAATGNIELNGSSPVEGNLHANGDITLSYSGVDYRVTGNIFTRGNYLHKGGSVGGYVRANGNAEMKWTTFISNLNNSEADILYGGTGIFPDGTNHKDQAGNYYGDAQFKVMPDVAKVPENDGSSSDLTDPSTNCDPLSIAPQISAIDDGSSTLHSFSAGAGATYKFTPNAGQGSVAQMAPVNAEVLGFIYPVYKLSQFSMSSNANVSIAGGDVFLYVAGNFALSGATTMTIEADSSLTLLIEGRVSLGAGSNIVTQQPGLTSESKRPSLSIYSSNTDDEGVSIYGDSEIYAAVYAPFTAVSVAGSGELYGAVRAKKLSVTGGAAIHFDHALANVDPSGGLIGEKKLRLVGWEY